MFIPPSEIRTPETDRKAKLDAGYENYYPSKFNKLFNQMSSLIHVGNPKKLHVLQQLKVLLMN